MLAVASVAKAKKPSRGILQWLPESVDCQGLRD
jgi:hypothetical protein